ncbi:MAG: hypothetical protein PWQ12_1029 [Clostridiales bacterium]|jgi:uncharacterized protein (TIGR00266 family)|nr:hypothetical protein [Clostridiales bacterium]
MNAHDIEYKLYGDDLQFVEIELDPGEAVMAEAGAMMYMDTHVQLETLFGDGSDKGGAGLMGKLVGAGKRAMVGESLFMTQFTNGGSFPQRVAFAAAYPGKIVPIDLREHGGKLIAQKDAYLCSAKGISIGIAFQRKIGVGFFGGEGFIMQKLEGDGLAFLHAGGTIIKRELESGEMIRLDTGCLVALTDSVRYEIEMVKGVKSALFGGEGLFFATLHGPGTVWMQSLPFSRLADRVLASARAHGGKSTGEGSALDILGGLGNLLDGK